MNRRLLPALLLALLFPATAVAVGPEHAFDIRTDGAPQALPAVSAAATGARAALRRTLGAQGILTLDPRTGTPRAIARLDGFLTGPATGSPEQIALRWAKAHTTLLGITGRDFAGLKLMQRATSPAGVTSLFWAQTANGVPSLDTGLRAAVDRQGRLLWFGGSPRAGLNRTATAPALSATAALAPILKTLGGRLYTAVTPILFNTGRTVRLGWHAWVDVDSQHVYDVIVDARSGQLLRSANRVLSEGKVKAWPFYPGAAKGGTAVDMDLSKYFTATDKLQGNNTHVFTDTPNDDKPDPGDEIHPDSSGNYETAFSPVLSPAGNCPPAGCSWNHLVPNSWQTNLAQNADQVFYFVNHFHDHLEKAPIGFTEASGNFQQVNTSGKGKGGDPVQANTTDGAATAVVVPNPLTNALNANMLTPPEGLSPRMQMYLFEPLPGLAPDFADINGGDDASVVYHEYTHGLTNRLVIDGAGDGALISPQSGAMGEAWSDFYALDNLIEDGYEHPDTDKPGELIEGYYTDNGHNEIRTEAVDCTLGANSTDCPRVGADSGVPQQGGYAYDAFGKIIGSPEVHADGEIWSQTLFELRRTLIAAHGEAEGEKRTLALVTGGLRISPPEPTYLDMRNSILEADTAMGGADHDLIWKVFAHRGMGYDAQATNGDDVMPVAGFALPPKPGTATGSVSGTVTDVDSGAKLAGVPAGITGFFSGLDSDFAALTGSDGKFHITGVPAGSYGKVAVGGNGYEQSVLGTVNVSAGKDAGGFDAKALRNWVLLNGGAKVTQLKAEDIGCGPGLALDADPGTGISFYADNTTQDPGPKVFTVKLPAPIDVSKLVVDPSANCGDDLSASTAGYKVEFSTDGATFKTASAGTFGGGDDHPNDLTVPDDVKAGVRYVRMTMENNQGIAAEPTGMSTQFLDMTDLSLYGKSRDKTPPKIKVAKRGVVHKRALKLRGRVTDDYHVSGVIIRGHAVRVRSKGRFTARLKLRKGVNRIRIDAYDASQNRAVKRVVRIVRAKRKH